MANNYHNFAVFDLETGGLLTKENEVQSPIMEIGVIIIDGITLKEVERYETFIQPYGDLKIFDSALEVTGITIQQAESGKTLKEVVKDLMMLFAKYTLGRGRWKKPPMLSGHNIAYFDIPHLLDLFERDGKDLFNFVHLDILDTLTYCKNMWAGVERKLTLTACAQSFNIEITNAHRAIGDVEVNVQLIRHILGRMRSDKAVEVKNEVYKREFEFRFSP